MKTIGSFLESHRLNQVVFFCSVFCGFTSMQFILNASVLNKKPVLKRVVYLAIIIIISTFLTQLWTGSVNLLNFNLRNYPKGVCDVAVRDSQVRCQVHFYTIPFDGEFQSLLADNQRKNL